MPGLLVADDTPLIRSTIARVVAQNKPEIYPVIEASDGLEAVELARQAKPDVILMDIKMPGLDGLQATAMIRAALPSTKIIVLTAYEEFAYVQEALKLGVADYLLKPIRPAKLIETLSQVYNQLQTERQQLQEVAETKSYLEQTLPLVETSLVDQLVRGITTDKAVIEASLKHLGKTISWPAVIVADIETLETPGPDGSPHPLSEIAPNLLSEAKTFLVGYSAPSRVIAIVSTEPGLAAMDWLRQLGAVIQRTLTTKLGLSTTVGLGRPYPELESISLSYAEASLACRHRMSPTQARVIHIDDIQDIHDEDKLDYQVQLERKLLNRVRLGEIDSSTALLDQWLDRLVYQYRERPDMIRSYLSELIGLVARTVIETGDSETDVLQLSHEQIDALLAMEDITMIRSWALSSLSQLIGLIPRLVANKGDAVEQALDYIRCNQHNPDISLNEVAEAVSLSSSHLAHLLKERVGMSYKAYLTSQRLEAAKKLLRTTDSTIEAVAEAVGYQNTTNFYRLFQRETGLTPAAYRRAR